MGSEKNSIFSPFVKLKKFFSSRAVRCIFAVVLLLASLCCVFLLDELNSFRNEHLSFLNSNFIASAFDFFGIQRFNFRRSTWYLFLCLYGLVFLCVFGGIFSRALVDKRVDESKTGGKLKKRLLTLLYYAIIVIIGLAIIALLYFVGVFGDFDKNTADLLLNFLYCVGLCAAFFIVVPIILFVLYFIIRTIVLLFKMLFKKKSKNN